MSIFSDALKTADQNAFTAMADSVTYSSGSSSWSPKAIPGSTVFRLSEDSGLPVVFRSQDFIIKKTDISNHIPARGDEITYQSWVYEVLEPGGEPCWQFSDEAQTLLRIHTKRIREVSNA